MFSPPLSDLLSSLHNIENKLLNRRLSLFTISLRLISFSVARYKEVRINKDRINKRRIEAFLNFKNDIKNIAPEHEDSASSAVLTPFILNDALSKRVIEKIEVNNKHFVIELCPGPGLLSSLLAERASYVFQLFRKPIFLENFKVFERKGYKVHYLDCNIKELPTSLNATLKKMGLSYSPSDLNSPCKVVGVLDKNLLDHYINALLAYAKDRSGLFKFGNFESYFLIPQGALSSTHALTFTEKKMFCLFGVYYSVALLHTEKRHAFDPASPHDMNLIKITPKPLIYSSRFYQHLERVAESVFKRYQLPVAESLRREKFINVKEKNLVFKNLKNLKATDVNSCVLVDITRIVTGCGTLWSGSCRTNTDERNKLL